jgi:hypothetical protein
MARLQSLLRKVEEGRMVDALNGRPNANRVQAHTELQARYAQAGLGPGWRGNGFPRRFVPLTRS